MSVLGEGVEEGIGGCVVGLPELTHYARNGGEEDEEVEGRREGVVEVPGSGYFWGEGFKPG